MTKPKEKKEPAPEKKAAAPKNALEKEIARIEAEMAALPPSFQRTRGILATIVKNLKSL